MGKELEIKKSPLKQERDSNTRFVVVDADGVALMKDIFFVPYNGKSKTGGCFEHTDGSPVDRLTLASLASVGAI